MEPRLPDPSELLAHAGWVRGLARALVGEDRADDLAQQTMLRAIEKPPRYGDDPRPWLSRVMRNLAWSEFRAEGRRRRRESRVGKSGAQDLPATPDELLARSEAHGHLVEALLDLEEPVRHLLILRYFEELTPAQISRRLGVPPGTVRAQLSRGLERLRSRIRRNHGEGSLHSVLLLAAPNPGAPATWLPVAAKAAALVTMLAVGGWFFIPSVAVEEHASATAHADRTDAGALAIPVAASRAVNDQVGERIQLGEVTDSAAATGGSSQEILIRGRCVSAEDGSPIQGCEITLQAFRSNRSREDLRRGLPEYRWESPLPLISKEDGRFEGAWPGVGQTFTAKIRMPGRAGLDATWVDLRGGQTIELGDVRMEAGFQVGGRVRDQGGRAVAGVRVRLRNPAIQNGSPVPTWTWSIGKSDEEGAFTLSPEVPAGTWQVKASGSGSRLVTPPYVSIVAGETPEPLSILVESMPTVSGLCVDLEGKPVSGARLRGMAAGTEQERMISWSGRSDEKGRFRLVAHEQDPPPFRLDSDTHDLRSPSSVYDWNNGELRVVLLPPLKLEVEVVERRSGEPVEDFHLLYQTQAEAPGGLEREYPGFHHPGGKLVVEGLTRSAYHFWIVTPNREFALAGPIAVQAEESGGEPIRIELARSSVWRFEVADEGGQSLGGVTVTAHFVPAGGWNGKPIPEDGAWISFSADPPQRLEVIGSGVSEESGRGEIKVPTGLEEMVIRLERHGAEQWVHPVRPDVERATPLTWKTLGSLAGRVEFWEGIVDRSRYSVALTNAVGDRVPTMSSRFVSLDGRGRFLFPELEDGEYRLHLGTPRDRFGSADGISRADWVMEQPPLASVTVGAEEVQELVLDARAFAPATVEAHLSLQGLADRWPVLSFRRSAGPSGASSWSPEESGRYVLDREGRAEVQLHPGEYEAALRFPTSAGRMGHAIRLPGTLTVSPGIRQAYEASYRYQVLRIRLLDGVDGRPLAQEKCVWRFADTDAFGYRVFTDSEGWLELSPAPLGRIRLTLQGRGLVLEELEVGPESLSEQVIQVPAGDR